MFISFSKTLVKFGGFRLGCGIRITKKNALWMSLVYLFVLCFQLMWYGVVLAFWLMYAFFYGVYWCVKAIIKKIQEYRAEKNHTLRS